jgi:amino-acid N-acetyltransferase
MSANSTQATTPTFRSATTADLADIERLLVDSRLPIAGVADIIRDQPADFVIAEAPDASGRLHLVAVGGLEVRGGNALLRSVAVRPEWQTHGIGGDLVRRIVRLAEDRGLASLYLLTETAERYFPRFGFEKIARDSVPAEVAETLEFKSACPASAVAMAKTLR